MEINKLRKAVGYIRTTTFMQDNVTQSLYNQKNNILNWAKENDIQIIKFYSEVSSGFRGARPLFDLMIKEIEERVVIPDALIVDSFDKLLSNISTSVAISSFLKDKNIEMMSASNSPIDSQDKPFSSQALIEMLNETQGENSSQTLQKNLNRTAEQGYFTGGFSPYGYSSVPAITPNKNIEKKVLITNPIEVAIVKELFNLATTGINGKQLSLAGIARSLNQQNLMRRGSSWDYRKVSVILRNSIYYGDRLWGKNRASIHENQPPIIIKSPSIISKKQFLAAQNERYLQKLNLRGNCHES